MSPSKVTFGSLFEIRFPVGPGTSRVRLRIVWPPEQILPAVKPQAAHPGGCRVASLALTREQGPYVGFEERGSVFLRFGDGRYRNHAGESEGCRRAGVPHEVR